jgi:hypothetical protein
MFAVTDHSGEATNEGLGFAIRSSSSPAAPRQEPRMVAAPLAALDLPVKVLVWADDPRRRSATPRRVGSLPATG